MVDFVVLVVCVVSLGFALAVFAYASFGRRPDLVEVIRYERDDEEVAP